MKKRQIKIKTSRVKNLPFVVPVRIIAPVSQFSFFTALRKQKGILVPAAWLAAIFLTLFVGNFSFSTYYKIQRDHHTIKDVTVKQISPAVVDRATRYTVLVKQSSIVKGKKGQYLVRLPKGASNISVKTISASQAKTILSRKTPTLISLLVPNEKPQVLSSTNTFSSSASFPRFLLASLEESVPQEAPPAPEPAPVSDIVPEVAAPLEEESIPAEAPPAPEPVISELDPIIESAPASESTPVSDAVDESDEVESLVEEPVSSDTPIIEAPEATFVDVSSQASESSEVSSEIPASESETETETENAQVESAKLPIESSEEIPAEEPVVEETPIEEPVVESEQETEEYVQIDYEVPAPKITEETTDTGKVVTVSDENEDPENPLTNVLAFTKIPEIFKVGQESSIKITWKNNGDQPMEFNAQDTDNNGKLDYIEWTVPHLSEQIFEIIFITKAFELDSNKNIIRDIYDIVKEKDNNYATIQNGHYVRVTFEKPLRNNNDITIFAKPVAATSTIKVYLPETNTLIATFPEITEDGMYKIILNNLEIPTDTFDLKIINADIDIDYIVDPTHSLVAYWKLDETAANSCTGGSNDSCDSSGYSNDGAWNGDATASSTVATTNFTNPKSVTFDGTGDYIDTALNPSTELGTIFTIAAWLYPTASGNYKGAAGYHTGDFKGFQFAQYQDNSLDPGVSAGWVFSYGNGTTWASHQSLTISEVPLNTWTHVVAVYTAQSGGTIDLYANGTLIRSSPSQSASISHQTDFDIGRAYDGAERYWQGNIDDVRVYNRALSTTEITALAAGNHTSSTWDGSSSATYATAANWSTDAIPDPYTNVTIADVTTQPILAAAESVASMTINSGATIDLDSFALTINDSGTFTNNGTLILDGSQTLTGFTNDTDTGTVMVNGTANDTGLATGNNYFNLNINDGLIGYWKLDEGSGTSATDSSGYANTGTLTSGPTYSSTVPAVNFTNPYSGSFDGTDDYVTMGDILDMGTNDWATSAWIKTSDTNFNIISKSFYGSADGRWWLLYEDGALTAGFDGPGSTYTASWTTTSILDDAWHHVAATWDRDGNLVLYVDGISRASTSISLEVSYNAQTAYHLFVGRYNDEAGGTSPHSTLLKMNGLIDDVRVYSRTLSAQEIQALAIGNQPGTSAATQTLGAALDVNGDLTLNSGVLSTSGSNYGVTVAGNWYNNGGKFTPGSGTVTFDGTASGKNILSGGQSFNNLTISGSGGAWTLADRLDVDSTLAISNGTLDTDSTASYAIHAKTWNQTGGTFTARSGKVVLDNSSSATLTPSSSFSTLRIEDPTEDGLVGYWKMDEENGTSAFDSSGSGNTGTLTNTPARSETVPTVGFDNPYSMSFDGTDDTIISNNTVIDLSSDFTVSFWVNFVAIGNDNVARVPLSRGTGSDAFKIYQVTAGTDTINASIDTFGTDDVIFQAASAFTAGAWYHLTFTHTAANIGTTYVDGTLKNQITMGASKTSTLAVVNFASLTGGTNYTNLSLDDVRIYDRALSATEVANLAAGRYAAGASSTSTQTLGGALTAATLALDSGQLTASSNNLTVTNAFTAANGNGTLTASTSGSTSTFNGGLTVSGGTLTGSSGRVDVNGDLTISSGTLTAPSGTLSVSGTFNRSGGTFTHNSGTVVLDNTSDKTLTNTQSFNNLVINDGLIGHWKLDDSLVDSSGYGNTGSAAGNAAASTTVPTVNFTDSHSYTFDGTGDYVEAQLIDLEYPLTISAWFRTTSSGDQRIAGSENTINGNGYRLEIVGGKVRASRTDLVYAESTTSISTGVWYQTVAVFTSVDEPCKIYLNGSLEDTDTTITGNMGPGFRPIRIGYGSTNYFTGLIDDVRIYNRALSATEIGRLAAGNEPATSSATTTLGGAITTVSNLQLNSGTLDTASGSNYGVTVAGNFENNGGVFTPRNGLVTLNGTDQGINSSNTFYSLTKSVSTARTLTFGQRSTQTFNSGGTVTLTGASGQPLSLRSAVTGTAWKMTVNGSQSVSYVDVKDSDASTGTAIAQSNSTDSGNNTNWAFNTAPSITAGPSDGSSSSTTPTNVGSNVTFTATATDADADNYYLAICKTDSVTAVNSSAPTCPGGNWAISSSTASGSQASVTYTALTADSESNAWFAFVCDHDASSLCSSSSQGSGDSGSPFIVNHVPSFSAIADSPDPGTSGATITFTATASDSDSSGSADTVQLFICKANDFSAGACGAGGTWSSGSVAASNPTATYTLTDLDTDGTKTYYANVIDNHSFGSSSNPRSGTFVVDQTTPTTTPSATGYIFGNWTNASVSVTLTCSDGITGTGCGAIKYCADTSNSCTPTTTYSTAVTISTAGVSYIRYFSTDVAGNIETTASSTVKIDTTNPIVTAGSDQSKSASFTQDATASDADSGIASYLWTKISGAGTITFGTATAEDTTISTSAGDTYVIRLTVTDNAGNSNYDEFDLTWTIASSSGGGGGGGGGGYGGRIISSLQDSPLVQTILPFIPQVIEQITQPISNTINNIGNAIGEILIPKPKPEVLPPVEQVVKPQAPSALSGKWDLFAFAPIKEFLFAPLPTETKTLAKKLPEIGKLFKATGIATVNSTVQKLQGVELTLPGLTQRTLAQEGLKAPSFDPAHFALPKNIHLADISAKIKNIIPAEVMFARAGNELIDFNVVLALNEQGKLEQKINTIAGQEIKLAVKPDGPVNGVKGYLVLKPELKSSTKPSAFEVPLKFLQASLLFGNPNLAALSEGAPKVEKKFLLQEFDYEDSDNDGIWTANIKSPMVDGDYEVTTIMDYKNIQVGDKEITLILVVDPEGYVYTDIMGGELRINGAIVSLYWLNPVSKKYELWPAKDFQQENPQVTDKTGKYAFLSPEGKYYLEVSAPNYHTYKSEVFDLRENNGIHMNIELKATNWWQAYFDWKIILIILLVLMFVVLFYLIIIGKIRINRA